MATNNNSNIVIFAIVVLALVAGFMFYQSQQADVTIDLPDIEINQ